MLLITRVSDTTLIPTRDKLTKVKRYWPGKAPDWAYDNGEEEADLQKALPNSDAVKKYDPRLRRLGEIRIYNREEMAADRRRICHAEIISTTDEERKDAMEIEEEEDEDVLQEQRQRIKENQLQRQKVEQDAVVAFLPEEEEEEESEYETDSEEEMPGIAVVRPGFVPKAERITIAPRQRMEVGERVLEERRRETKLIVIEKIREEQEIQKDMEIKVGDVDTDDELNQGEEYQALMARRTARKRDREAIEAILKEKEEINKVRRNMRKEERREWARKRKVNELYHLNRNPLLPRDPNQRQKWRFMQKYYHKGAFFQSDADDPAGTAGFHNIYTRDFSAPTGEDKMDKTILPRVMQVKHFGRSGRTKWTHLLNEDTTACITTRWT